MMTETTNVRKVEESGNGERSARNVQASIQAEGFRVTAKIRASCAAVT